MFLLKDFPNFDTKKYEFNLQKLNLNCVIIINFQNLTISHISICIHNLIVLLILNFFKTVPLGWDKN